MCIRTYCRASARVLGGLLLVAAAGESGPSAPDVQSGCPAQGECASSLLQLGQLRERGVVAAADATAGNGWFGDNDDDSNKTDDKGDDSKKSDDKKSDGGAFDEDAALANVKSTGSDGDEKKKEGDGDDDGEKKGENGEKKGGNGDKKNGDDAGDGDKKGGDDDGEKKDAEKKDDDGEKKDGEKKDGEKKDAEKKDVDSEKKDGDGEKKDGDKDGDGGKKDGENKTGDGDSEKKGNDDDDEKNKSSTDKNNASKSNSTNSSNKTKGSDGSEDNRSNTSSANASAAKDKGTKGATDDKECAGWKTYALSGGKLCPKSDTVVNATTCEAVLKLLKYGYKFAGSTSSGERPPGCFYVESTESGQFNKKSGTVPDDSEDGVHAICARCLTEDSDDEAAESVQSVPEENRASDGDKDTSPFF